MSLNFIIPNWPAPPWIRAAITTKQGGVSTGPYTSFNLGDHVGDAPESVAENRSRLNTALSLPAEPIWLRQVHSCTVADADRDSLGCTADASIAFNPGRVCAVLTADCLPILLCDQQGKSIAAIHGGWRGLATGIIEATIKALKIAPEKLLAWLGPAIGPDAFEVGEEVRAIFIAQDPATISAFHPSPNGRWLADIYALARRRLHLQGVKFVGGGDMCTVQDQTRFFSYRRDGTTGRMASLIWIDGGPCG